MKAVKEKIREIVGHILEVNLHERDDGKTVMELGVDSLQCIEIVIDLEEEFGIKIQDSDADGLKTVNDIDIYLEARGIEG